MLKSFPTIMIIVSSKLKGLTLHTLNLNGPVRELWYAFWLFYFLWRACMLPDALVVQNGELACRLFYPVLVQNVFHPRKMRSQTAKRTRIDTLFLKPRIVMCGFFRFFFRIFAPVLRPAILWYSGQTTLVPASHWKNGGKPFWALKFVVCTSENRVIFLKIGSRDANHNLCY